MRSEDLDYQGQYDWRCNHIEPSGVELIEWTNKGVIRPVFFNLSMVVKETGVGELNKNRRVEECRDEDCRGPVEVVTSYVFRFCASADHYRDKRVKMKLF